MKPGSKFDRPASGVFHAVTHVWGGEYLDVFLNVCIPNQLAAGNVPALPPGSRYRILTRSLHAGELESHPMVHALREVIPVDVVVVDALDRQTGATRGHELMVACHQRAVTDALDAEAAVIFLSADFVFSDNACASIVRRHHEGARAVVNTGLRLAKEPFLEHLRQSRTPLATMSSRELVRMALPHLHPHTRSMFVDGKPFSRFPVAVYWRVGDDGLLARCLHLHPLMVDPMGRILPRGTIDGRYVARACPDASRVHVVVDSDELQMFELTPGQRTVVPSTGAGASVWRVVAVAVACDERQIGYWQRHPVRLHGSDLDGKWAAADAAADAFAGRVLRLLPYGRVPRRYFWLLERLRERRDRYSRAYRRRLPRVRLKRISRPVRIVTGRVVKAVRRSTRRLFRQAAVR